MTFTRVCVCVSTCVLDISGTCISPSCVVTKLLVPPVSAERELLIVDSIYTMCIDYILCHLYRLVGEKQSRGQAFRPRSVTAASVLCACACVCI